MMCDWLAGCISETLPQACLEGAEGSAEMKQTAAPSEKVGMEAEEEEKIDADAGKGRGAVVLSLPRHSVF